MPFAELAALFVAGERWLLPGECLGCQSPVGQRDGDALVCGLCVSRWHRLAPPWCPRCGQPTLAGEECRLCAAWPAGLGPVRSAVWLDDATRGLVHRLKYEGWWRLADPMAGTMRGLEPLAGAAALVPVPLGPGRRRRRGYNQAERLAAALAVLAGLPVRPDLLVRSRETTTQTALAPEARRANIAGAFAARGDLAGARIVLVDDVFTTGATLAGAAAALLEAGAGGVGAVTFARARPPVA